MTCRLCQTGRVPSALSTTFSSALPLIRMPCSKFRSRMRLPLSSSVMTPSRMAPLRRLSWSAFKSGISSDSPKSVMRPRRRLSIRVASAVSSSASAKAGVPARRALATSSSALSRLATLLSRLTKTRNWLRLVCSRLLRFAASLPRIRLLISPAIFLRSSGLRAAMASAALLKLPSILARGEKAALCASKLGSRSNMNPSFSLFSVAMAKIMQPSISKRAVPEICSRLLPVADRPKNSTRFRWRS